MVKFRVVNYTQFFVIIISIVSVSSHSEYNTQISTIDHNFNPIAKELTEDDIRTVLSLLVEKIDIGGTLSQTCNSSQWESSLKLFLPSTTKRYPLLTTEDWRHLISVFLNRNHEPPNTSFANLTIGPEIVAQDLYRAVEDICFIGGPFTICNSKNRCVCDERYYVQDSGICLGKLHADCGMGVDCVDGLKCVFQRHDWLGITDSANYFSNTSILGHCGGKDDIYYEYRRKQWPYKRFELFMQGVVVSSVSVFGVIGNVLSALVLTRPQLGSSMSYVLLGMTVFDIVYLVGQFMDTGVDLSWAYFTMTQDEYVYLGGHESSSYAYLFIRKWSYFLYEIGNVGSIYFTVLVSLERYIVVCHTLKARSLCTKKKALHASLIVFAFAVLSNLPRLFATRIMAQVHSTKFKFSGGLHKNSPLDRSIPNMTIPIFSNQYQNSSLPEYYIMTTSFGYSKSYNLYLQWGKIIFKYFIPFYWLIFFNFWIIIELQRSDQVRRTLTIHACQFYQYGKRQKKSSNSNTSTTRMMLCVVGVFGFCYLPLFLHEIFFRIPNYLPYVNNYQLMNKAIASSVIYSFVKLFATLNSSVNFIIYCLLGEKFRKSLKLMLQSWFNCLRGRGKEAQSYSN